MFKRIIFEYILSVNGEENDYIFSWVNKIPDFGRLYSKKRNSTTNRMFSNLLLNESINLNKSEENLNHEVINAENKCDNIISNIPKKNYCHSVGNDIVSFNEGT